MGICVTTTSSKNSSETKDLGYNENKDMTESIGRTVTEDDNSPVVVVDASIIDKLKVSDETPNQRKNTTPEETRKRVPLVIQRTLKESDIFDKPSVPLVFVIGPQRLDVESNVKRLTEIRGRLLHLDMTTTFFEVASVIGSQDQNMIPPPKALEVLISRITSEAEDLDAMLVTGYPRSMRDVVEYMARVQRIDGIIFLEPQYDYHQNSGKIKHDKIRVDLRCRELDNFRSNLLPIIQYFEKQEVLYKVTLKRPSQNVYHDIYDKVMLVLSRQTQSLREVRSAQNSDQHVSPKTQNSATTSKPVAHKSGRVVRNRTPSSRPTAVNKDIDNVLSLVQAGSILQRVSSSKK